MIVLALVTTDGGDLSLGDAVTNGVKDEDVALLFESVSESGLESELEFWLATLLLSPVSWTDQELGPPPETH